MLEYFQRLWDEFAALSPLQQVILLSGLPLLALIAFLFRQLSRRNSKARRPVPSNQIGRDTVMVVDDDSETLNSIAVELRTRGYAVHAYDNPENAIAAFPRCNPSLVIVDGAMIPYGGPEVLRRIRTINLKVPVILITAFTNRFQEETSLVRGFDDYVEKPLNLNVLMARVEALLRRGAASQT